MSLLLGVDTGGTYTDAVIIRDEKAVLASAKSLTTRHDLAVGVGGAVKAVLDQSGIAPASISLASLSTTLATNALVEGQGGRVALVFIGFSEKDMENHGLIDALKGDPYVILQGGHDHAGGEVAPLDVATLTDFLKEHGDGVSGFAVAAQFSTRNPAHEQRAMALIAEHTGKPGSASHQLSAKLGGPKRALTAVLNARLIGMIDRLIGRAEDVLADLGVTAPMMVVRGDGALISSAQARLRPIETILSGPAASIVGASWMTNVQNALVSDIGGTTTDVAILRDGRPGIDPAGARVGPFRTMVEAVSMRTTGLGGDSEVHFKSEGLHGGVTLGPRRVLPISLIAHEAPDVVLPELERQARSEVPGENDGRFVRAIPGQNADGLDDRASKLLGRIGTDVHPLGAVLQSRMERSSLRLLIERGLVQVSGVTPSDASHALGWSDSWNVDAARMALSMMGNKRTGAGEILAQTPEAMAKIIVDQLTHQTAIALLEAGFAEDSHDFGLPENALAQHVLMQAGLGRGHGNVIRLNTGLALPVVGLGASAKTYYPAVGEVVGSEMILPDYAGVANAVGAVVGRITMRRTASITAPSEGQFRVHTDDGPLDFMDEKTAFAALEQHLRKVVEVEAQQAGAEDIQFNVKIDRRKAVSEGREVFVEAIVTVEAAGRPRIAAE